MVGYSRLFPDPPSLLLLAFDFDPENESAALFIIKLTFAIKL